MDSRQGLEITQERLSNTDELERILALYKSGHVSEAIVNCHKLVIENPYFADAHTNLGVMLHRTKAMKEAYTHLQKAHELDPFNPLFCLNLANLLRDITQYEKAILLLERAVQQKPDYAAAWLNLGALYKDMGFAKEASGCFSKAKALNPDFHEAASNYAYTLLFLPSSTPEQIYEAHVAAMASDKWQVASKSTESSKIGFVSGDFREHPAAYFTIGTIEWLNRNGVEVFLYANQIEEDEMTKRFKAAGTYRTIHHLSDEEAVKTIIADHVQVLFDLSGHNARGRLGIFARRAAPVQITWAGYMTTTGLSQMDYIIGDKWHMKEGDEKFYTEKIIRLPYSFICFDAPTDLRIVESSGHLKTFGCFNIPAKINAEVVRVWAAILNRTPDSRLILKAKQYSAAMAEDRVIKLFEQQHISPERIIFIAGTSRAEHLSALADIDISLDPFPFSGSTTTLESLFMGTPVITMPGSTMASRHSESYLRCLGLDELVAENPDEYIKNAALLAADFERLNEYKATLRDKMRASPLCDVNQFAPAFLNELKKI